MKVESKENMEQISGETNKDFKKSSDIKYFPHRMVLKIG